MRVEAKNVKMEIHDLIDRLDDSAVSEALEYIRKLVHVSDKDEPSPDRDLDSRMGTLVVSGSDFVSHRDPDSRTESDVRRSSSPIRDFDNLKSHLWPEDELIDELVASVRQWRREGGYG